MNNGVGLRVTIFFSGCSHNCPECQNPQTHDLKGGVPFNEADKEELFNALDHDYIHGITLSGGDPLFAKNIVDVYNLLAELKQKFPTKTVWCYTGYTFEEIMQDYTSGSLMYMRKLLVTDFVDVLIDGEYKKDLRDLDAKWRGSSNQRVIDIKKTLEKGELVLFCD